jgi:hypothetical protein
LGAESGFEDVDGEVLSLDDFKDEARDIIRCRSEHIIVNRLQLVFDKHFALGDGF